MKTSSQIDPFSTAMRISDAVEEHQAALRNHPSAEMKKIQEAYCK